MAEEKKRVKEQRTEPGFGGNDGAVWVRVRDLKEGEEPPKGSRAPAAAEQNHDWQLKP